MLWIPPYVPVVSTTTLPERPLPGARVIIWGLGIAVLFLLLPYVSGLIGAIVLFVIALPLVRLIDPAPQHRLAALTVVILLFFVLVLPGLWLLAQLAAQLPEATRTIEQSAGVQKLLAWEIGDVALGDRLRDGSSTIIAWSSRQTMLVLGGALSGMLNLFVALFGAYYLLTSGEDLWRQVRGYLPFCPTTSEFLRIRFHRVTEAMLLGVVLTGVAQGTIVGGAFAFIGFPNALFWGAVTAVVSVLPMFGSGIVWGPAVLLLLAQQRFVAAAILGALGILIVSNVDNALRLIVYRRVSQIHPMITLVGAFAGVRAFGLAGLLLGPLVLSFALELFKLSRANTATPPALEVAA